MLQLIVEGRIRRGRARLRWEQCMKRDLAEMGGVRKKGRGWR